MKAANRRAKMSDVEWYCNLFGLNLLRYQKLLLLAFYGDKIKAARERVETICEKANQELD